jgi:anthranilate synthase component 1
MTALHRLELPTRLDLGAIQAAQPERYPALFRTTGTTQGWDILFAYPQQCVRCDTRAALHAHPAMRVSATQSPADADEALPFRGGWLAFLPYEVGALFEPSVGTTASDAAHAWLLRIPAAILQQSASGRCVLLAEHAFPELIVAMQHDAQAASPLPAQLPALCLLEEDDPERFLSGLARIADYIRAGDVFQVNLSRAWQARFAARISPAALFAQLMAHNPAPFSVLLQIAGFAVVSSSPERLVSVDRSGAISTRPIAGTHPRGVDAAEDDALRQRLAASPKERAEHVMLVDLERNDLGRVCVPGSVRVDALMELAQYQYVHHIESTISGVLRADTTVFDVLRAVFPGGTITGCPKLRTMQIIRELEATPRGAYTGSIGYINHDGSLDFNILIRSFELHGDTLKFRAGAGIVADSLPARELAETRAKARGLLRALGAA